MATKTAIDLETTVFDLGQVLDGLPMTATWIKGSFQEVPDFGTIFIGLEKVTNPKFLDEILDVAVAKGPIFKAPIGWNWAQIARAFGIFDSATQARKNGWDGSPEPGFNFRIARINKVRGELLVVKITDDCPWVTEG